MKKYFVSGSMSSYRKSLAVVLSFLLLSVAFIPRAAASGNPVIEYLQSAIKPALDTVQRTTDACGEVLTSIQRSLGTVAAQLAGFSEQLAGLQADVAGIEEKIDHLPQVTVVRGVIHTTPNGTTGANFTPGQAPKIRRYTVVLQFASLSGLDVAAGVNKIEIVDGILIDDITSFQMTAYRVDPSANPQVDGTTFGPYAGTNSFIRVVRGNDGLGDRDVFYNAYIEALP